MPSGHILFGSIKENEMIDQHEVEVLGRVTLVSLHGIHLWTARKKISQADFPGVEFPPEQLVSMGSKHVLDPERLKTFERCKREAHSECARVGVKFLGRYAVPEEKLGDLLLKLRSIKTRFMTYKKAFLSQYDQFIDDWANADWKKPEWKAMILRSLTPKAVVATKFDFGFTAMKIVAHPDEELSEGLGNEVKGLTSELVKEVTSEARNIIQRGMLERGTATQGTINTLKKIAEKIDGLKFLSPFVQVVSDYVSRVVNSMPDEGSIKDDDFQRLSSLVVSLSTEYGMKAFMSVAKQNQSQNTDPFGFLDSIYSGCVTEIQNPENQGHEASDDAELIANLITQSDSADSIATSQASAVEPDVSDSVVIDDLLVVPFSSESESNIQNNNTVVESDQLVSQPPLVAAEVGSLAFDW